MQNAQLAQWLQDHTKMLGNIKGRKDNTLYIALYEGIIEVARQGNTRMIDTVLESAAAHAVAVERELIDFLGVLQLLRRRVWQRVGEEVDPEPAFDMLSALDEIFVHVFRIAIDTYLKTTKLAVAAKSVEISRLYNASEQKVMEYATEVARANRELERLEQAKTDFIGVAAHELKTPLTLIRGYVNILRDMPLEENAKSLIEGVIQGSQRMHTIIEDMLDLSGLDMNTLGLVYQEVRLKSTIDLVLTQFGPAFKERQQTIEALDLINLPVIEADANRIHQIFRQIISNAIKYTPDEGHITIKGRAVDGDNDSAGYVEIIVGDTGVGIAPEDQHKIFERFYRASDSALHSTGQTKFMGAGPGLGLAIVKGLVEAHGGKVLVESPGFDMKNLPGTSFIIILPIQAKPQAGIDAQWIMPKDGSKFIS